jgi:hypothetical protein
LPRSRKTPRRSRRVRSGPAPKEKAKPNRLGLVLTDLTDEQRKELDGKTGVLIEDTTGTVRGNVQPGRHHSRHREPRADDRREER